MAPREAGRAGGRTLRPFSERLPIEFYRQSTEIFQVFRTGEPRSLTLQIPHQILRTETTLERAPAAEKSEPAHIILNECEKMISHLERSALLDAALIFSGNQLEHYQISLYGSLSAFARDLGFKEEVVSLLDDALAEEKAADRALTRIAEDSVNLAATGIHNPPPFALL
jgi:hypothetical protein